MNLFLVFIWDYVLKIMSQHCASDNHNRLQNWGPFCLQILAALIHIITKLVLFSSFIKWPQKKAQMKLQCTLIQTVYPWRSRSNHQSLCVIPISACNGWWAMSVCNYSFNCNPDSCRTQSVSQARAKSMTMKGRNIRIVFLSGNWMLAPSKAISELAILGIKDSSSMSNGDSMTLKNKMDINSLACSPDSKCITNRIRSGKQNGSAVKILIKTLFAMSMNFLRLKLIKYLNKICFWKLSSKRTLKNRARSSLGW